MSRGTRKKVAKAKEKRKAAADAAQESKEPKTGGNKDDDDADGAKAKVGVVNRTGLHEWAHMMQDILIP